MFETISDRNRNPNLKWFNGFINEFIDSVVKVGFDKSIIDFSKTKDDYLPQHLYKFFAPSEFSIASIINNNIYLSSPKSFNDPFDSYILKDDESYVKYNLLQEIEKRGLIVENDLNNHFTIKEFNALANSPIEGNLRPELGHNNSFTTRLYKILDTKTPAFWNTINSLFVSSKRIADEKTNAVRTTPFKVACFANFKDEEELGLNTAMWSHYSKSHTGFCVKYDLDFDAIQNKELFKFGFFPVFYSSRVPKLTLRDYKSLTNKNDLLDWPPTVMKKMFKMLVTKSRFWSYEKEWRLIISNEYDTLLTNSTLPFFKIKSIYIGCRANSELTNMLVKLGDKQDFKLYRSIQSDKSVSLDFYEINKKTIFDSERALKYP
jgi:hypothetical protein